ncbi:hypothetical protein M2140_001476 [Clostridiales Family XIII bacterium PM5-7]
MAIDIVPFWMQNLEDEDVLFIKNFIMSSGSLKQIAKDYGVTYPTVRLRLDRLISKIQMEEDKEADPFVKLIKRLTLDDRLDFDTAKLLITAYNKDVAERGNRKNNDIDD